MTLIRKLLGPSQREAWEHLCEESGAEYDPGNLFQRPRVRKRIENWTVTLTASKSAGTDSGYENHDDTAPSPVHQHGRLPVHDRAEVRGRASTASRSGGISSHAATPILTPNSGSTVKTRRRRALLDNPEYCRLLEAQSIVWLKVKDHAGWFGPKFPENVDMLIYEKIDVKPMTDVTQLQSLLI